MAGRPSKVYVNPLPLNYPRASARHRIAIAAVRIARAGPVCTGRAIIFNSNSSSINLPAEYNGLPDTRRCNFHASTYYTGVYTRAREPRARDCLIIVRARDYIQIHVCILFRHCAGSRASFDFVYCLINARICHRATRSRAFASHSRAESSGSSSLFSRSVYNVPSAMHISSRFRERIEPVNRRIPAGTLSLIEILIIRGTCTDD